MTKVKSEPQGKLQVAIMEQLKKHKVIKASKLHSMIRELRTTVAYSKNKLKEKGLLESHGAYICLPGHSEEVPQEQINKLPAKRPFKPRQDRPLPDMITSKWFTKNPPFVMP